MACVDYAYYTLVFKGTAISSSDIFDSLEVKAEAFVDRITFGRVAELTAPTDAVKKAVCAVCEVYQSVLGHEGKSSENNDGYSVSYVDESTIQRQLSGAAMLFLPSGLTYRGF